MRPASVAGPDRTGGAAAVRPPDDPAPGPPGWPLVPGRRHAAGRPARRSSARRSAGTRRRPWPRCTAAFPGWCGCSGHVDVVHGAYYALICVVVRIGGPGEFAVRLPSALALAVAAAVVAALGGRLVSSWAGLAAGLAFAVLPSVSWFAETAREGALRRAAGHPGQLLPAPGAPRAEAARRRWLIGYGVTLAALGLANLFGLLLVVAHAVTLACLRGRYRVAQRLVGGLAGRGRRGRDRGESRGRGRRRATAPDPLAQVPRLSTAGERPADHRAVAADRAHGRDLPSPGWPSVPPRGGRGWRTGPPAWWH